MIKWGILGLGNMANHFAKAVKVLDNAKLVGVASKSQIKLIKFSKDYDISKNYTFNNYKDLIESNSIDSIYISTLNNTHNDLILKCIKNNKNILCEKPMCVNVDDAKIIYEKLKHSSIFFNEAIAYRSHPQTIELLKLINENEIGKIKKIESSFGFKVRKINKKSRLFNPKLGGGAILDLGCYPISFFQLFLKENEKLKLINAEGSFAITGVDDYAKINFVSEQNIKLNAKISLKENLENNCKIYGTNGIIIVPSPWLPSKKSYLEIIKDNSYYKKFINTNKNVYTNQIENVSNKFKRVENKINKLLVNINDSVDIMKTLGLWREKISK
jgi:dihydrodiol dehydrogenase / D-xylose 1-dehydrogenase (NADP)